MASNTQVVAGVLTLIAVILVIFTLTASWQLTSTGEIRTLGVVCYADPTGTMQISVINWGTIGQGETSEVTIYLKLTGNTQANLTMTVINWVPTNAPQYLTVTWDYVAGTKLQPGTIYQIKIRLSVASNVSVGGFTSFSNTITIVATQTA